MSLRLTPLFNAFFASERASTLVLIACTAVALLVANSSLGAGYAAFWHTGFIGMSVEHWVNDALMAVFFLLIGLELERELYVGELASLRNAVLPLIAAVGGIVVPAGIHFSLNAGLPTQAGAGIPMATDIAFALGALSLLGSRIPPALKVFLTALAVSDDLGAIIVIALFYSSNFSALYFAGALATLAVLVTLNIRFRVMALTPYLVGGALMWYLTYRSGVHATLAGVALAFAIPFRGRTGEEDSPSHRLEQVLHRPVAFVVLPLFALANTGVHIEGDWVAAVMNPNGLGIIAGLSLGKVIGISLFSLVAVRCGLAVLPEAVSWRQVIGVGFLGGIGFTMSIFVTNLAFPGQEGVIAAAKAAIMLASIISAALGLLWLQMASPRGDSRSGVAS